MINNNRRLIYPEYSKGAVNRAAKNISSSINNGQEINLEDEIIVENWRASHIHVLNTWQVILRKRIKNKTNIIFAQRLKRRNTIYDKLCRYPDMNFARMHDIAGCRLIFRNEKELMQYRDNLHSAKQFKHKLKEQECKNYIETPKNSGYRGIHDVYIYESRKGNDRSDKWNGLSVEIQYRTIYQHAWSTAVEVADSINNERSKFSEGDEKQQEFFRLASEIIARAFEHRNSCRADLSNAKLIELFTNLESKIKLLDKLTQLKAINKHSDRILEKNAIIIFNINNKEKGLKTIINTFKNLKHANTFYFELEKKYPNSNIVLVRSDDKKFSNSIKNAYRNYFADTGDFTNYIYTGLKILENK